MAPDSKYEVAQCDYPWISVFYFYPFQIFAFLSYYLYSYFGSSNSLSCTLGFRNYLSSTWPFPEIAKKCLLKTDVGLLQQQSYLALQYLSLLFDISQRCWENLTENWEIGLLQLQSAIQGCMLDEMPHLQNIFHLTFSSNLQTLYLWLLLVPCPESCCTYTALKRCSSRS